MSTQPQPGAVTYGEVREWAVILGAFTASDIAHAMGVDVSEGQRAVTALVYHGICVDTGTKIDGRYGYEPVISYVPPPPGPTTREPSGPDPEQTAITQAGRIVVKRGEPVRIRTERQMRKSLSTPGARQFHKNRERNYDRMQGAKAARAEAQRKRAQKDPKWKRKK